MTKQSFVTGQVLTAQQVNDLQTNDFNQTVSAKTASYTLVAADKGTRITMSSTSATTITVNTGLFAAGDTLFIQNLNTGVSTITAGTATVSTSASLALAQHEGGLLYFTSAGVSTFFKAAGAAAASGGMTLLSTTTATGSSTTISSINQTHKHLLILGVGLFVNSNNDMFIRLNGNSSTDYFRASIVGTSSASASINTSQTELGLGGVTTNTGYSDSTFFQMNIYRYTETEYKNITASMRANADQQRIHQYAFNSTAAITSITLGVPSSFSGGTIYIYGVS